MLEETLITFLLQQARVRPALVSHWCGFSLFEEVPNPQYKRILPFTMSEIVGVCCRVFPDDIQFIFRYSVCMFDARL